MPLQSSNPGSQRWLLVYWHEANEHQLDEAERLLVVHYAKCSQYSSNWRNAGFLLPPGYATGPAAELKRLLPPARFKSGPAMKVVARAIITIMVKICGGRMPRS